MENSEALTIIYFELEKLKERIDTFKKSGVLIPESGLQLISSHLVLAYQTLETLQDLGKMNHNKKNSVSEETTPIELKVKVAITPKKLIEEPSKPEEIILKPEPVSDVKKKSVTFNEEKPDNSLAGKMKSKPIRDLKTAIGINEKFAFIKLFGGDATAWNNALQKLNSFSAYWEAEALLDEYNQKYSWKEEDETLQTLSELVQRRYL